MTKTAVLTYGDDGDAGGGVVGVRAGVEVLLDLPRHGQLVLALAHTLVLHQENSRRARGEEERRAGGEEREGEERGEKGGEEER